MFGSGYLRPANATWGSLATTLIFGAVAIPFFWMNRNGMDALWGLDLITAAAAILAALAAIWWGEWAVRHFQSKDPRPFVLDEFAGQFIALLCLPPLAWSGWGALAAVLFGQFLLFRFFDVSKLPPAKQLESLPAGWGITCDDLVAGFYANVSGQLLWRFTPLPAWLGLA